VSNRKPEQPLQLQIAPGVVAARASQTVVILEPIDGNFGLRLHKLDF
jgi:hypothetical protein